MKRRLRQRWYRLRDGFRDGVWAFARRIDPAVGSEHLARVQAIDDLLRFAMAGMPKDRRVPFSVFSSPQRIAEAALQRADREGFYGFGSPTRRERVGGQG